MDATETQQTLRFGHFQLDFSAGELTRDGKPVRIQPQPFRLLALLARSAGTVVSREQIRQELWPDGTFVDFEQSVNFSVKQVREALGDHADHPLYVETVPRRGYRFIAPVQTKGSDSDSEFEAVSGLEKALWENVAELRLAQARRRRYLIAGSVVAGVVVLLLIVFLVIR